MRLLFISHGDPDYENDTLTEKGVREAECLAKYIQKISGTSATGWGDKTYNGVSCYGNDITLPSGNYDSVVLQIKQISTGAGDVSDTVAHNTHIWFE